jgi:hypothetical protein
VVGVGVVVVIKWSMSDLGNPPWLMVILIIIIPLCLQFIVQKATLNLHFLRTSRRGKGRRQAGHMLSMRAVVLALLGLCAGWRNQKTLQGATLNPKARASGAKASARRAAAAAAAAAAATVPAPACVAACLAVKAKWKSSSSRVQAAAMG